MNHNKQKFFIDCQIVQTDAFDRGMGKYSLSLLEELISNDQFVDRFEPIVVLNKNLPIDPLRLEVLGNVTNKASIIKVELPNDITTQTDEKYALAQKELTDRLKKELSEDEEAVFLIMAPFFIKFAAVFPQLTNIKKLCVVYDLIPYLLWQKQKIFPDNIYFKHYELFIEADSLLTISEAVKSDLMRFVGVEESKISSIDGGPFEVIRTKKVNKIVSSPYVLYPSAPIFHKNNIRAAQGFSMFNAKNNGNFKLVMTSTFDEKTKKKLTNITEDILFTGNVSNEDLSMLYRDSSCVLFASLAEGLGMPVLEAVMHEKPVACSKIPVLEEISKDSFYGFNPLNPKDIAVSLSDAVAGKNWRTKNSGYTKIIEKYSWHRSAIKLISVLDKTVTLNEANKPKLLVIAPSPRYNTPAARFVEDLYASLSEHYYVSCNFSQNHGAMVPSYVPYVNKNIAYTDIDIVLCISDNKANKSPLPQKPCIQVVVRKQKRITLSQFSRKQNDSITINALPYIADQTMQIKGWKYLNAKKILFQRKDIIVLIKKQLSNMSFDIDRASE